MIAEPLEVPPNELVYHRVSVIPNRSPYPALTTLSPQPCTSTRLPASDQHQGLRVLDPPAPTMIAKESRVERLKRLLYRASSRFTGHCPAAATTPTELLSVALRIASYSAWFHSTGILPN